MSDLIPTADDQAELRAPTPGRKASIWLPGELQDAIAAWEQENGRKLNLSDISQAAIRLAIDAPDDQQVMAYRLDEAEARLNYHAGEIEALKRADRARAGELRKVGRALDALNKLLATRDG